jgi:hypothetical protein
MPRSPLAYLLDIVEACAAAAIESALSGLELDALPRQPAHPLGPLSRALRA